MDLLSPFVEESPSETASVLSADYTITEDRSEKGSNTTVYRLSSRQGGGADPSPPIAKKGALKWPSDESSSQPKKRQRTNLEGTKKRKSEMEALIPPAKKSKISSNVSEWEDESFNPTLEREDKDTFKVKAD